jgi:hypothetical protein
VADGMEVALGRLTREAGTEMTDNPRSWTDQPLYASWPGRILWLFLLVFPDLLRSFYPDLALTPTFRVVWYAVLAIVAIAAWRMSSRRKPDAGEGTQRPRL